MSSSRPTVVQRVRHVPGELLRSRDLRDGVASEAELLWWHQRAVHDATGVVSGLVATHPDAQGPVHVSPGVAYDPRGRELVLVHEATIDAPAEGAAVLVLCGCADHAPGLGWARPDRVGRCDCIALASWQPESETPLLAAAGRARATSRPRIASGETLPGATAWEPWLAARRTGFGRGLEVRIDTRAAGFTAAPCYFAWLRWPRAAAADSRTVAHGFGLQHVADETAHGFTFRVLLRAPSNAQVPVVGLLAAVIEPSFTTFARTQRLSVAWLALEGDHDSEGGA